MWKIAYLEGAGPIVKGLERPTEDWNLFCRQNGVKEVSKQSGRIQLMAFLKDNFGSSVECQMACRVTSRKSVRRQKMISGAQWGRDHSGPTTRDWVTNWIWGVPEATWSRVFLKLETVLEDEIMKGIRNIQERGFLLICFGGERIGIGEDIDKIELDFIYTLFLCVCKYIHINIYTWLKYICIQTKKIDYNQMMCIRQLYVWI